MNKTTFFEYLQKIFYPFLCEQGVTFPVIVFIDGHTSHFSFDISQFCQEKKIVLIALFPNSTHLIQPMDVAVFGPLKKKWRDAVHQWKYNNNNFKTLTKEHFAGLLQTVITEHVKSQYLQSGFKASGLFPFSPDGIDYEKLLEINDRQSEKEVDETEKEIERARFASAFKCIGDILGAEKENAFYKFYTTDKNKPWDLAVEDTTAYHIWRESFERSRRDQDTPIVEEHDDIETETPIDLMLSEEISDWIDDPNVQYYYDLNDQNIEFELVDELLSPGVETEENRRIHVIDNTILVAAPAQNTNLLMDTVNENRETDFIDSATCVAAPAQHSENEYSTDIIRQRATDVLGTNATVIAEASTSMPIDALTSVSATPIQTTTTIAGLYNLQTSDTCPVSDVFLKCLKPQPIEIKKQTNNEQKFSVPKIKGKISLNFSSPYESHYISSIDFDSGTSVVSSKWHRSYIEKHMKRHEMSVQSRSERNAAKKATNANARNSTKANENKFVLTETPSESNIEWTDEEEIVLRKKKKEKTTKKAREKSKKIAVLDTSFSSDVSSDVIIKQKKIRKNICYTSDESEF